MMILTNHRDKDLLIPHLIRMVDIQMSYHPDSKLETGTGWSGSKNLLNTPRGVELREYIQSKLPISCNVVGWGNYLTRGQEIGIHNHTAPGNVFSGVYYLTSGTLNIHLFNKQLQTITFQAGDLVIFPSETMHSVSPVERDIRISVAFNASPK